MDTAAARATMIECQVRTNDVSDLSLQTAMRQVPRELFVVPERAGFAYAEVENPTPSGRVLWMPRDFAKLAQAAAVLPGDRVLVIAGAGGYSAAVFAAMGARVTVLDDRPVALAGIEAVTEALDAPPAGPFDVVFVDGAVGLVPAAWNEVLDVGGRLCVVETNGPVGKARVHTRSVSGVAARTVFDASPPKLRGFEPAPAFVF
jgi:protein-L-isoaspartate(D-aspartate) O-methyltransferase